MSYLGSNLTHIYVIQGREYDKQALTDGLIKQLGPLDNTVFNDFRFKVINRVGDAGKATIRIYPRNKFEAYDEKGQLMVL